MYTEKAVSLIRAAAKTPDQKQFFYFAIQSVHSPYMVPEGSLQCATSNSILSYIDLSCCPCLSFLFAAEYLARFSNLPAGSMARRMHAMVSAMDDFIGNTTQALRNTQLWETTLFILVCFIKVLVNCTDNSHIECSMQITVLSRLVDQRVTQMAIERTLPRMVCRARVGPRTRTEVLNSTCVNKFVLMTAVSF